MKTTFELPDALFRSAKANAAGAGISLREFFTQAIAEKLHPKGNDAGGKPWLKGFGALGASKTMRAESRRIQRAIESEFGSIRPDDWK